MLKRAHVLLNTSGADGFSPPVEFRLFRAGVNDSSKGSFLFDEQAAALVMANYGKHGADIPLDLEHLSLDPASPRLDAHDARAWFGLEVRNGELWAVNVRWTPDGERRLRDKTQRYVSPAFDVDEDGRIVDILNVALTALPATHNPYALIAASKRTKLTGDTKRMDPKLIQEALTALKDNDAAKALEILEGLIVVAAGGDAAPAEDPPPADPALAEINAVTEAETPAQALSVIKAWKKAINESAAQAAVVALSERKSLVGKLVTLGAETPATAYTGEGDAKKLADRLVSEPIDSLRARVTALSAAKKPAVAPARGAEVRTTFTPDEIAGAKRLSAVRKVEVTPAEFVALKNAQVRTH
jgi:phage I-like protein